MSDRTLSPSSEKQRHKNTKWLPRSIKINSSTHPLARQAEKHVFIYACLELLFKLMIIQNFIPLTQLGIVTVRVQCTVVLNHLSFPLFDYIRTVGIKNLSSEQQKTLAAGTFSTCVTKSLHVCTCAFRSSLALPLLKHLQVHANRLLDGFLGDKVDKVLDVRLPVGQ